MFQRLVASASLMMLAACGGGSGGEGSTNPAAPPIPVSVNVNVMSSDGSTLGAFVLAGDTRSAATIAFSELAARGVRTAGTHEKFMVLRGANQGDRIGPFIANTGTGALSFTPEADRTALVLWLFPNVRFPYVNLNGRTITYECFVEKSNTSFVRGIVRRYNVTVGKFREGMLIWSGPWRGPDYDLGTVNIVAYDGPDYPIIEALTLLNQFLNIGPVKLGSFVYTGAPNSGDMVGGWGYDEIKQPGFEGLHDVNGQWFIQRYYRAYVERYGEAAFFRYSWDILYIEAFEAWTRGDDVCGGETLSTFRTRPIGEHASFGWTQQAIDLTRFAALWAPGD